MSSTLYGVKDNYRTQKILVAAEYSGHQLQLADDFNFGTTNKTDSFLSKFPLGKIPAYESADNSVHLFESTAIMYHVADTKLTRCDDRNAASQVLQWVEFGDNEILPNVCTWVYPCLGVMQFNKGNTERAKEELKRCLNILNEHLKRRTFLVGERVSLADISVAICLVLPFKHVFDGNFRQPYGNVVRWFETCVNQKQFKEVLGEVALCESMAQFDAKKFKELTQKGKLESGKPEKQKQQSGGKKQQQEKAEKKPEAASGGADDDDEDEAPKKKEKDPFAKLPAGDKFVFDEWKKMYSNNDIPSVMKYFRPVAMPWFFEHFDAANYSVWFCKYLFPEELRLTFMTSNLIRGMSQRLDRMRKHAFGSMCIFGENNNNTIAGVWIWRGQDLAFLLSEDLQTDYESYSWEKLDYEKEETKKLLADYFAQNPEGFSFDGKPYADGQIFK